MKNPQESTSYANETLKSIIDNISCEDPKWALGSSHKHYWDAEAECSPAKFKMVEVPPESFLVEMF